nr:hypothetical protein [Mycobacterium sp. GA-1199]
MLISLLIQGRPVAEAGSVINHVTDQSGRDLLPLSHRRAQRCSRCTGDPCLSGFNAAISYPVASSHAIRVSVHGGRRELKLLRHNLDPTRQDPSPQTEHNVF